MSSFENLSFCKILSLAVFKQLEQLMQQMAQVVGAVILTESVLAATPEAHDHQPEKFTVLISPPFRALLVGVTQDVATLEVQLTFEHDAIAQFLTKLDILSHNPDTQQTLNNYR